jgi:hypothetical protein
MRLYSTLICPACRHASKEVMPLNACQIVYNCRSCRSEIRARAGECCVFCSFADVPCPPAQRSQVIPNLAPMRRPPEPLPHDPLWSRSASLHRCLANDIRFPDIPTRCLEHKRSNFRREILRAADRVWRLIVTASL